MIDPAGAGRGEGLRAARLLGAPGAAGEILAQLRAAAGPEIRRGCLAALEIYAGIRRTVRPGALLRVLGARIRRGRAEGEQLPGASLGPLRRSGEILGRWQGGCVSGSDTFSAGAPPGRSRSRR